MNYLTKLIYLDKSFGFFIVVMLEFVQIIKNFLKKNKFEQNYNNIFIIKFLGIGSISRTISLIESLKIRYPNAKIIFITFSENKDFIKLFKSIDKIILINKKNFFYLIYTSIKLILNCLFEKKSLLIDLEAHSNFSKIISFFNNSKTKIGFHIKKKILIYNKSIFFDRNLFLEKNYKKILDYLNCEKKIFNNIKYLDLKKSFLSLKKKLQKINIKKKETFFIININSSDLCVERKWDLNNFIKLIDHLLKLNFKVILIGSNDERKKTNIIMEKFLNYQNKIFNFAGNTTIGELIAIFEIYKVIFVTNDSGPLHLANLSRCPTISLWGPGDPQHYADKYDKHIIIYEKVFCSPCIYINVKPPCNGNNICMKKIRVLNVLQHCLKLVENYK